MTRTLPPAIEYDVATGRVQDRVGTHGDGLREGDHAVTGEGDRPAALEGGKEVRLVADGHDASGATPARGGAAAQRCGQQSGQPS